MSYPRMKKGAWMLLLDGERARILENAGTTENPDLRVLEEHEQDNPPNREQGAARPGRMNDAGLGHKSAVQETDFHRQAKESFAEEVLTRIESQAAAGRFQEMIIAAPPMILGIVRKHMGAETRRRVVLEIDKDLTKHTPQDVARIVLGT